MPHHHMQHARNVGPILFTHDENIAHVIPCVTACAVTSRGMHTQASRPPEIYMACQELLMNVAFAQAKL